MHKIKLIPTRLFVAAFLLCGLITFQAQPASAQLSFTVTRSDDRNNAACVSGDCSLREAVNAANASAGDDTINFASGLSIITLTDEIVIGSAGALIINGLGANVLTIDGGAGDNRILRTDNAVVIISGLTLTGGGGNNVAGYPIGYGGAISAVGGSLTLDGVHVTANRADAAGGGAAFVGGTYHIINSTFSGNVAYSGGGFYFEGGTLTVVNSTISDNAALYGGGFYIDCFSCDATLRNATITGNNAEQGGGIYEAALYYRLNLGNTILAGNSASYIAPENYSECNASCGAITSAGGNIVGDSPGDSTNTGSIAIAYQPTDIRDTNPMLGALQNNGGTTSTHALLAGSPAIDKGLNSLIAPVFDQRGAGFPRIRDGNGDGTPTVDIGAFEIQLGAAFIKPAAFDFDGDRRADLSVFRPSDRIWYLNGSQAGFSATPFGLTTDKLTPADYDGDGKTDIAVYRAGTWFLQRSSLGFISVNFGDVNDIPQPADYDGDGKADLAVYRPSNGVWYVFNLVTNQLSGVQFGASADKPVAADYDGDGKTDYCVYRNGTWYLLRSMQGFSTIQFGVSTDKPVVGDYDGDGKADIAVFRPSNGVWYLLRSNLGVTGTTFGVSTDLPTPADYDGDGKTDIAVFRSGTWLLQRSSQGFTSLAFGAPDDKPVPNAFIP